MAANPRHPSPFPRFSAVRAPAIPFPDGAAVERQAAGVRADVVIRAVPKANRSTFLAPMREQSFDVLALVREQQDVRAELATEQLEQALDLLIECRLVGRANDMPAKRHVLFDLYERGVVTKSQVRQRGELSPSEFHEELRTFRMRSRSQ